MRVGVPVGDRHLEFVHFGDPSTKISLDFGRGFR
jgi:hypothetical protein